MFHLSFFLLRQVQLLQGFAGDGAACVKVRQFFCRFAQIDIHVLEDASICAQNDGFTLKQGRLLASASRDHLSVAIHLVTGGQSFCTLFDPQTGVRGGGSGVRDGDAEKDNHHGSFDLLGRFD